MALLEISRARADIICGSDRENSLPKASLKSRNTWKNISAERATRAISLSLSFSLCFSHARANFRGVLALLGALTKPSLALDRVLIPSWQAERYASTINMRYACGARFRRDSRAASRRVASRRRNRSKPINKRQPPRSPRICPDRPTIFPDFALARVSRSGEPLRRRLLLLSFERIHGHVMARLTRRAR